MALLHDRDQRERKRAIGRERNKREEVREGRKYRLKEVQDMVVWKEWGRVGVKLERCCVSRGKKREERTASEIETPQSEAIG